MMRIVSHVGNDDSIFIFFDIKINGTELHTIV